MSHPNNASFLYPLEVIQHVFSRIKHEHDDVHATIVNHLKRVYESRVHEEKAIPAFRHFADMKWKPQDTIPYDTFRQMEEIYNLAWLNVHSGQRKLVFGLLEFVLQALQHLECSPRDLVLIYAGASGKASAVISQLFPGIKIVLYDPEENTVNLIPRSFPRHKYRAFTRPQQTSAVYDDTTIWRNPQIDMYIFTEHAGWFTDETVQVIKTKVLPHTERKHHVFVSDVRGNTSERDIVQDMKNQARWTIDLEAEMYMYKFRIPYETSLYPSYSDTRAYLPEHLRTAVRTKSAALDDDRHIHYLQGKLHLQLFAPPHSLEMRLIGNPDAKGKYVYVNYDAQMIERNMALFNVFYRSFARFTYAGITGSYDYVFQTHIVRWYLEQAALSPDQHENVLADINTMMMGTREVPHKQLVERKLGQNLQKQYTSRHEPIPEVFRFIFDTDTLRKI